MPRGSGRGGFGSGTPSMNGARGKFLEMELSGTERLKARFRKYEAGLSLTMNEISYEVAQDIAEVARVLVAVDTGLTKKNIKAERGVGFSKVSVTRGGERDAVPAYLELGTHKMAARPFLKPAGEMAMAAGSTRKALREVGGLLKSTMI